MSMANLEGEAASPNLQEGFRVRGLAIDGLVHPGHFGKPERRPKVGRREAGKLEPLAQAFRDITGLAMNA
jgi:hypothetical protein